MGKRSRQHRKRFRCGHRGYGRYCHRCAIHTAQRQKKRLAQHSARQAWNALFAQDVVDLTHLPKKIVVKARQILSQLSQGASYWQMGGKRLQAEREAIKIPVGYRYRLLCRQEGDKLIPTQVLSHEAYNAFTRNSKRILSAFFSRGSSKG